MSVAQRGTPSLQPGNSGASLSLSVTSAWGTGQSPAAGDLLVAVVTAYGSTTITPMASPPSGWVLSYYHTALATTTGLLPSTMTAVYTRVAAGSDTAPVFTAAATGTASYCAISAALYDLYDTVSGATPVLQCNGLATGTSSTLAVTTDQNVTAAGSLGIVAGICSQGTTAAATTWTTPSGWTLGASQTASARAQSATWYTTSAPSTGAALAVTLTHSRTSTAQCAVLLVAAPSGTAPSLQVTAAGPGSAGYSGGTVSSLTWTMPVCGANTAVLVAVAVGTGSQDAQTISSVTLGGTSMGTPLTGPVDVGAVAAGYGYLALYALTGVTAGMATVTVTLTGSSGVISLNCGGLCLANAAQTSAFTTAAPYQSETGTNTLSTAGSTAGGIVAGFTAAGSTIGAASSPGTGRWLDNHETGSSAGCLAGQTSPSTGSAVTVAWAGSPWYATFAAEVHPVSGTARPGGAALSGSGTVTAGGTLTGPVTRYGTAALAGSGTAAAAVTLGYAAVLAGSGTLAATAVPAITGSALSGDGTKAWFTGISGHPRLLVAEDIWGLPPNAGAWGSTYQSAYDTYFAARAAQGFTAAEVALFSCPFNNNAFTYTDGRDWDGTWPFTSTTDPGSGFNATWWARRDYMFTSAAAHGITIVANVSCPDTSGDNPLTKTWTNAQWTSFGTGLGGRYAAQPNILWIWGDDYFGGLDTQFATYFLPALRAAGDSHLVAVQNMQESTSRYAYNPTHAADPNATSNIHAQYDWVYTYNPPYNGVTYAQQHEPSGSDLVASQVPVVWGDGFYMDSSVGAGQTDVRLMRQNIWWALSSGAVGFHASDNNIYPWGSGSAALVTGTSPAETAFCASVVPAIVTAFTSLAGWHLLVSDWNSALVTSGRGTPIADCATGSNGYTANTDAYVSASRVPDGSLAVIYCAQAFSIGIDQTKMAAGYTAKRVDPLTGAATTVTAGSSYSSSGWGNNSAGDPDWVLVLQGTVVLPAAAALTGSGTAAAGVTAGFSAALSGTGTAAVVVTLGYAAALAGTGTLAVPGETRGFSAALAGTGTAGVTVTLGFPVALAGDGALTVAGAVLGYSAALSGSGTAAVPGTVRGYSAPLAGAGTLAVTGQTLGYAAALSGSGTVTAGTGAARAAAAALSGAGTAGVAVVTLGFSAALAGTGTAALSGGISGVFAAAADLAGTGTAAVAVVTLGYAAALAGTGTAAPSGVLAVPAAAALAGSGLLTVPGETRGYSAALAGGGTLAVTGAVLGYTAALAGGGTLAAVPQSGAQHQAAAVLTGTGTVTGGPVLGYTAVLAGTGTADAGWQVTACGAALLTGQGTASPGGAATRPRAASLTGTGLAVAVAVTVTPVPFTGEWAASPLPPRWQATPLPHRWKVTVTQFEPISALSVEEVAVDWVTSLAGTVTDPTSLPVQFAVPVSSGDMLHPAEPDTWYDAQWLTGTNIRGYVSYGMPGPEAEGGAVRLTAGTVYDVWFQVLGSPARPVKFCGQLPVY